MKITIYELLGLIKDDKAPKKIKYQNVIYIYYERLNDMFNYKSDDKRHRFLEEDYYIENILNDTVEILEEEKETKPLTKKDIEALGYACGEIQKFFTNGWAKALENKPFEEEKKIPEKLIDILRVNDLKLPVCEKMYKIWQQTIKNQNKINEIIDYLKSKGE